MRVADALRLREATTHICMEAGLRIDEDGLRGGEVGDGEAAGYGVGSSARGATAAVIRRLRRVWMDDGGSRAEGRGGHIERGRRLR